jgi:hypothetical protein
MPTRMNPMAGRYFNDPNFASGLSNLAAAFAPPSADEALGWAELQGRNVQNDALTQLIGSANGNVDILGGVAAGGWTPNQGFENFRGQLANERYNIDTDAATTLATNAADNEAANRRFAFGTYADPAGRQSVEDTVMEGFFPGMDMPGYGAAGPVAPTDAQVQGADRLRLQEDGLLTDDMLVAEVMGSTPVEQIVTPEGPRIAYRTDAVGQEPFINKGAEASAKLVTYRTPDGRSGTAIFDPATQSLTDEATGARLPEGTITGQVQDTAEGLGRTVSNRVDASALASVGALATIDQLEQLITANPGSQGLVGILRGTAQDVMQTGNELGRFFGGTVAEVSEAANAGMIDAGLASQMFDPSIPAIQMLMNVLAWQYAKSFAGDRVSNEQLQIATRAIGASGAFQNQANSLTRLGQLRDMFQRDLVRNADILSPEVRAQAAPFLGAAQGTDPGQGGAGTPRPRAVNPDTQEVLEWDGQQWVPAQ